MLLLCFVFVFPELRPERVAAWKAEREVALETAKAEIIAERKADGSTDLKDLTPAELQARAEQLIPYRLYLTPEARVEFKQRRCNRVTRFVAALLRCHSLAMMLAFLTSAA